MNDWRLQGQEKFLMGATLAFRKYEPYRSGWDHDHCEFCGIKFSKLAGDKNEGYVTHDMYRWICKDCFEDFRNMFHWVNNSDMET